VTVSGKPGAEVLKLIQDVAVEDRLPPMRPAT
jgi:hypothetical protein